MSKLVKYCSKCNVQKPLDQFHKQKQGFMGRRADCRRCRGCPELPKQKIKTLPEARAIYMKQWYEQNRKERIRYARDYLRRKRKEDIQFKLKDTLRQRINKAIKQDRKPGSAIKDLGMPIGEFKIYLEKRFQPGMSWDNYGDWHIDHIRPLSSFNLTDPTQFRQAVHYTNLQPLWRADNLRKGKKIS